MSSTVLPLQEAPSQALLEKYNTRGPRYTSYPTAPVWKDDVGFTDYQQAIAQSNGTKQSQLPLSLYVHIPFCESRCLYCSCNVVITPQREQAEKYLGYLFKEIDLLADQMAPGRSVVQYHWGGGTPTYLNSSQIVRLFEYHTQRFNMAPNAEVAIEIDPRVTTTEQLETLRALGFNRVSLGVQDFNAQVQEAVNRIQPMCMTANTVDYCRDLGFGSINFDLIYGLPYQTVDSFRQTLNEVIAIGPDRIALYNYAYVPWISLHQKYMDEKTLPTGQEKFQIFRMAMQALMAAGYVYIGMDHFAKPTDELAIALSEGRLHRNFMGYTVQNTVNDNPETELYAVGSSAISGLQHFYAQNHKKLSVYYDMITNGQLPIHRGYALSADDQLRRQIIQSILCQGELRYSVIEQTFGIEFQPLFASALQQLDAPTEDGLLLWHADGFTLTPLGRVFSRNIAMPFDAYLPKQTQNGSQPLFSKTL